MPSHSLATLTMWGPNFLATQDLLQIPTLNVSTFFTILFNRIPHSYVLLLKIHTLSMFIVQKGYHHSQVQDSCSHHYIQGRLLVSKPL